MRKCAILVLLALAIPNSVASKPVDLEFLPPGQLFGTTHSTGATWFALFFAEGGAGNFEVQSARFQIENFTYTVARAQAEPILGSSQAPVGEPSISSSMSGSMQLGYAGVGMLLLKAADIAFDSQNLTTNLAILETGVEMAAFVSPEVMETNPYWSWNFRAIGPNVMGLTEATANKGLAMTATGVSELHWYGAHTSCAEGNDCPDGGGLWSSASPSAGHAAVAVDRYSYWVSNPSGASVRGIAQQAAILLGGESLDYLVNGSVRLPLAKSSCSQCASTDDRTITVTGAVSLLNTHIGKDDRIFTHLGGAVERARIDESFVDPASLGLSGPQVTIGASAIAGILAILKFLLAPFFTRLTKEQALEHPRRRRIFEYIQENPGANFREVARRTGIAAGTVRHHLNVLARSDIIVEHQHGSTVRLFENLSKFQSNWADHVLLREPSLGELYDWLKANPGAPQKAVLEGMEPQGWSRSTTQHRLSRLVDGGLATIRLQGRLKIYTALDRSSNPPAPS
jgi:predicted transcriptional regulator